MEFVVNYVAIIAAAIAAMLIGWAWYSPMLFGAQWMKLRGMDPASMKGMKMPMKEFSLEFIASLVTAWVLAVLIGRTGAVGLEGALKVGALVWLGFYATLLLGATLWEKKPFGLFLINAGQRLVTILVMAAILASWV